MEFAVEPVERGPDVVLLAVAVVVCAGAQACAAEVEAQYRPAERVQGFHCVEDDFVVQRAAEERMRMRDHRRMCGIGRAFVEEGFEWACRAFEEEGADGGSWGHGKSIARSSSALPGQLPVGG